MKTVLVVSEEADLVDSIQQALQRRRYAVLTAPTAYEARQLLQRRGKHPVHLLIVDPALPRGEAFALANFITASRGAAVLFLSEIVDDSMGNTGFWFLRRPFTMAQLIHTVRLIVRA